MAKIVQLTNRRYPRYFTWMYRNNLTTLRPEVATKKTYIQMCESMGDEIDASIAVVDPFIRNAINDKWLDFTL